LLIWALTYLLADIDLIRNIGASAFFAALLIGVAEIFFHIYMKKVILHGDEDSRESTTIGHDKYAMEISDEYVDYSRIKRGHPSRKVEDRTDKLK